jgi:hypothetical protein
MALLWRGYGVLASSPKSALVFELPSHTLTIPPHHFAIHDFAKNSAFSR